MADDVAVPYGAGVSPPRLVVLGYIIVPPEEDWAEGVDTLTICHIADAEGLLLHEAGDWFRM